MGAEVALDGNRFTDEVGNRNKAAMCNPCPWYWHLINSGRLRLNSNTLTGNATHALLLISAS